MSTEIDLLAELDDPDEWPAAARAEVERLRQERGQLIEQRDTARNELAEIGGVLEPFDFGGSYAFQVRQLADEVRRLRRSVLAVAEDLERYAADMRPEKLPMSERKLAWTLREIVAGEAS